MSVRTPLALTSALLVALVAAAVGTLPVAARQSPQTFTVDPTWPQEFPNHWVMGSVTGVFVDSKDHVWITSLPETLTEEELYEEQVPPQGTCCKQAPVVIEARSDRQGRAGLG
ncbi:MAG: hypothetical protein U0P30_18135 [Vicinamibacterales bacterium]